VNWRMVTFSFVAMDQIVNQASKIRYMFGGQADFPVTYRCTTGGGMGLAAQHSQSPYSMWMHLAGLKIVLPSSPSDAKGLLKTARAVIVDEAPATCSAASEIAALIVEDPETFRALKAPVRRVCALPVPVPYSPVLEQAALPGRDDIKAAVYEVMKESLRPP